MNHDDKSLGVMSHHRGEKHLRLGVGRNTSEFTKGLREKKKKQDHFLEVQGSSLWSGPEGGSHRYPGLGLACTPPGL